MRRAWPAYRSVSPLAISIALLAAACGSGAASRPLPFDLARDLSGARLQPPDFVRVADVAVAGATVTGLVMRAPSRATWTVRFPERAEINASVAFVSEGNAGGAGVTIRIAVSDGRAYEEVTRVPVASSAWQPIRADLTPFSGWKWSLFYQPSRRDWQVIIGADPTPGGTVVWKEIRVVPYVGRFGL